ncbi:glycosyltransferase family 2 protein [Candidatus Actinomarina sp.]|nr:glycosyltransferase family 2 protein [Candidatus Actinomarina sp.]
MTINLYNLRNEYIAIVPVFNEQNKVEIVLKSLISNYPILKIYIIDDGSTDETKKIIEQFKHNNVTKLFNNSNYGKGYSIRLALSKIRPDKNKIIFFWDGDDELDVTDITNLIHNYENDASCSILFGSRFLVEKPISNFGPLKVFINYFLTYLFNIIVGTQLTDMETAVKSFNSILLKDLILTSDRFEIEPEITFKLAKLEKINEFPISYKPRTKKEGKKISFVDGIKTIKTIVWIRKYG